MTKLKDDNIKWILDVDSSKAQQGIHSLNKENKELEKTNKSLRSSMNDLIAAGKKESVEFKNLEKTYKSNSKTITENKTKIDELEKSMGVEALTMAQLRKRAKELQTQLNHTSKATNPAAYAKLEKELGKVNNRIGELNGSNQKLNQFFKKGFFGAVVGGALVKGLRALWGQIKEGVKTIIEFQKANSDLAAILGTTANKITRLTKNALELGRTMEYTASQVTSLQIELAKLGFSQDEILASTEYVLNFATATGGDLPAAAQLAGASLRIFGLDATEMERVVSTLSVATTKSALDFGFLENAMSTVGPVAKSFGFSIEATTALLGTLADSGFDASSAATATRNILLNLADANGKLAQELGKPIKSLDDLIPAFAELKAKGVDLNKTLELTDRRSVAAFNTFLQGTDKTLQLRDSISDAGDALQDMVEEKLNNVVGATKMLSSAWEGLMLNFSNSTGIMKSVVDWLTQVVSGISDLMLSTLQLNERIIDKQVITANKNRLQYIKEEQENIQSLAKVYQEQGMSEKEALETAIEYRSSYFEADKKVFEDRIELTKTELDRLNKLFENNDKKVLKREYGSIKEAEKRAKELSGVYGKLQADIIRINAQTSAGDKLLNPETPTTTTTSLSDEEKKRLKEQEKNLKKILADTQALVDAETKAYNDRLKEAGIFGKEQNKLTENDWQERIRIESDYQNRLMEIASQAEEKRFSRAKSDAGIDKDPQELTADQNKALEILQAQHEAKMQQIQDDGKKKRLDIQKSANSAILQSIVKLGQEEINTINAMENARIAALTQNRADGLRTEKEYQKELKQIQDDALRERLESQQSYMEMLKEITNPTEEQKKAVETMEAAVLQIQKQINERKIQEEKSFQDRRESIREQYGLVSIKESYQLELEALKKSHEDGLLSEEEYQQSLLDLRLGFGAEYVRESQKYISAASDTINALQDAENARAKTKYEEDHTALKANLDKGIISQEEYNDKKEQLDYKLREKELDIEKKYADAQFAIKVAEISSAAALGIMNAWASSMTIPPPAGQIMAGVLTGLITATSLAQIAAANQQRKAVKATTLEGSSGSSNSNVTGKVVLNEGFKEGGMHADNGGYTGNGGVSRTAGYFSDGQPVHGKEYVVANPEMRIPAVASMVRKIDNLRAKRVGHSSLPNEFGYQDGGTHTSSAGTNTTNAELKLEQSIDKFGQAVDKFANTSVKAEINMTEFKESDSFYDSSMELGRA